MTCTSPRSPSKNCTMVLAFVSMTHSMTILPAAFLTAIEILALCTSIPTYLILLVIKGVPPLERLSRSTQNLLHKGRPLYCVVLSERWLIVLAIPVKSPDSIYRRGPEGFELSNRFASELVYLRVRVNDADRRVAQHSRDHVVW